MTPQEIVSDEFLEKHYWCYNYDWRNHFNDCLLKVASGMDIPFGDKLILAEVALIANNRTGKLMLTASGKKYLYLVYSQLNK